MVEIKCPKCGEKIEIGKDTYNALLGEIATEEVERRIKEQEKLIDDKYKARFEQAVAEEKKKQKNDVTVLTHQIELLKEELKNSDQKQKLAVAEALQTAKEEVSKKDAKIVELNGAIALAKQEKELSEKTLKEQYEAKLTEEKEKVAYYRDLKTKMSTKLVGETLEQHCEIQFNSVRMAAYPNAYFEKDNDASSGSKGDYIFRECDEDGNEIISIMFEMKNENDTTATKHKNEDFFKELDKDRNEKNCEYAVLVSMLEADNELYNSGIVDVSYRHKKMFVVRPQCFLAIIALLRNAALNAADYKKELAVIKNQSVDVSRFEDELTDFQTKFGNNYRLANERFTSAIEEIDKSIAHLNKIKENLLGADRNLRLANDKLQDLSIKKLTHNNETMTKLFDEAKGDK